MSVPLFRRNFALTVCLLAISFLSSPADPPSSDLVAPGGVWWKNKTRIRVTEELTLLHAVNIQADEVWIEAPIVTNGNRLTIEARRLVFTEKSRIDAFTAAADDIGEIAPAYATAATPGGTNGGGGANGAQGKDGFKGVNGYGANGHLPGEIFVFGGEIKGRAVVIGVGEAGGKGGKGGVGQKGGAGGQGSKADVGVFKDISAGRGGNGGAAGKGGKGGTGGAGGAPVPVAYLMATEMTTGQPSPIVQSEPGKGGPGGDAGIAGEPGDAGPGGAGDSAGFPSYRNRPSGRQGEKGAAADNGEAGAPGPSGPMPSADRWFNLIGRNAPLVVQSFPDFEAARFKVSIAWYDFHWWRQFELIARTSLSLLFDEALETPLNELLGGEVQKTALRTVADRWEGSFVRPLKEELNRVRGRNSALEERLSLILKIAEPYTVALTQAKRRGAFRQEEVNTLRDTLSKLTELRRLSSQAAFDSCTHYISTVIRSDIFRTLLRARQTYFEVPVCMQAAQFLSEDGVQSPIQIAEQLQPNPELNKLKGVVVETSVAPELEPEREANAGKRGFGGFLPLFRITVALAEELPRNIGVVPLLVKSNRLKPQQLREFYPSKEHSSVVGSLGLHKGYLTMSSKDISLENLDTLLYGLVKTAVGQVK